MGHHPDVLVIGGGVVGLTTAYVLARAGTAVELIDQGDLGREASWAGAGIIPPGHPDRAAPGIDALRAWSASRFPALSADLRERTGVDNGFHVCGGVEFFPADDPARHAVAGLWEREGIAFAELSADDLAAVEPGVKGPPRTAAVRVPGMAQVRPPWHLRALEAACRAAGVRLRPRTPFAGWATVNGKVIAAQTMAADRNPAGRFVVAAGAWADLVLRPLGWKAGVHPVRGQVVLFRPHRPVLRHVLLVGKRYLVPRPDGRVLAGSTEEPEAGYTKATTADGVADLTAFARALVPALASADVEAAWAGLRPGSPDGLPYLGPVPGHPNVFAACGHYRAGVQLSVGSAEVVARLARGEQPPVPADPFRPGRPPNFATRPAFRS